MIRASTTARLALLVFLGQMIAAAALLAGIGIYVRWQVAARADAGAEMLRDDLLSVYAHGGVPALARTIQDRTTRHAMPGAIMLLADRNGVPVAGPFTAWPHMILRDDHIVEARLPRSGAPQAEAMRLRVTRLPEGARLLTGMAMEGEANTVRLLEEASLAALVLAMLLAVGTAHASARMFAVRLVTPIEALQAASRGDFARRAGDAGGDAFAALGRVVNATLDRLDDLVSGLKLATDAMAHDLKSPITRVHAALHRAGDALLADPPDPGAARAAIARAEEEAGRLLAIVETALSISRAEAGIGREGFRPVDIAAMLESLAEIYGPVAEDAGRAVALGPIVDMPPMPVHRELLGQAIGNLIDNALKYGSGTILLTLATEGDQLALCVADAGGGIAPDDRATALRKFGRLDAARSRSGAGLGLSLVAAVARLHGGRLALRDAVPGLAACLLLPRGPGDGPISRTGSPPC